MGKITGTNESINRVKQAKAGDKSVYINYEAINDLPEDFDVNITKVEFDIEKDFSDVGNNTFMPNPALHYVIAEAKGISGLGDPRTEPIYEQVNINEMDLKPDYKMLNIIVGYRCTKQSRVMTEDGTDRLSSPCTIDYNVWNRCIELWSKEEMFTEGYTKPNKYSNKYDNRFKRKEHFNREMKFAMQKAETKAYEKTIRELAGLMTGYKAEDLKEKAWYFAKVRRSKEMLKMEAASRLIALERGEKPYTNESHLLFGPAEQEEIKTVQAESEPVKTAEPVPQTATELVSEVFQESKVDKMQRILEFYMKDKTAAELIKDWTQTAKLIDWLAGKPDVSQGQGAEWFGNAVAVLKGIEKEIPEFLREKHDLY